MAPPRYRAAAPDTLLTAPLDPFVAVFHRASGITHLLTEPAPEILAMLYPDPLTAAALFERLAAAYDLADGDRETLVERLDELVATGLVEAL
ncbi:HPr-rel-A system PqqD family peptide chaperone [Sphingomonas sp. NY01]|uniref:HPr-rel-A system PqqD family peptide chaperone n=1 Tax=Sphingomonas sp. NY01 TaxID=2968057 RepID=UPI00315C67D5